MQHDWNFADSHSQNRRLDHHFRRELHSGRAEIHPNERLARKAAQSAMEVACSGSEKQSTDAREDGIPQVTVLPGHGPRPNTAQEPISHDEIIAGTKPLEKRR